MEESLESGVPVGNRAIEVNLVAGKKTLDVPLVRFVGDRLQREENLPKICRPTFEFYRGKTGYQLEFGATPVDMIRENVHEEAYQMERGTDVGRNYFLGAICTAWHQARSLLTPPNVVCRGAGYR